MSGPAAPKSILPLAIPLVISFTVRAAFTLVDRFYAASLDLADASQAAIGLTMPFEFLMIACWVGTSNGLTARLAAAMGAREGCKIDGLKRATGAIIVALVALFLIFAAGIWFLSPHVGLEPEVAQQFRVYGAVLLAGSAITSFWSILPDSLVKAHQDTKSTMWAGLLSGGTNVVLNTLFVFVFHWGIFGIALSTVIGRLAGLLYAMQRASYHERKRIAAGQDNEPGVFDSPLRAILALALPASVTYVVLSIETFSINGILAAQPNSTSVLAAWSVFDGLVRFLLMPPIAVGVALLPLTAHLWGARDTTRVRGELWTAERITLIYGVVLIPLGILLGPWLASVLTDGEEARAFAALGMAFVPINVLVAAPFFLYRSSFDGLQEPRPGLIASLVRAAILTVPLVALGVWLAPSAGAAPITGAFLGYTIGAGGASVLLRLRVRERLGRMEEAPA